MGYFDDIQFVTAGLADACLQHIDSAFPFYTIELISAGQMYYGVNSKKPHHIDTPAIFWHRPDYTYRYGPGNMQGWQHYWVGMLGERAKRVVDALNEQSSVGFLHIPHPDAIRRLFEKLVHHVRSGTTTDQPECILLVERIMFEVNAGLHAVDDYHPHRRDIREIAEIITDSPEKPV
jgi:hypothetical protein